MSPCGRIWAPRHQKEGATVIQGTVKSFNADKGYGYIKPDEFWSDDIFVHYTAIDGIGHAKLDEGERVEFEVVQGTRGPQPDNVRRI